MWFSSSASYSEHYLHTIQLLIQYSTCNTLTSDVRKEVDHILSEILRVGCIGDVVSIIDRADCVEVSIVVDLVVL